VIMTNKMKPLQAPTDPKGKFIGLYTKDGLPLFRGKQRGIFFRDANKPKPSYVTRLRWSPDWHVDNKHNGVFTGFTTVTGLPLFLGPEGGLYHISTGDKREYSQDCVVVLDECRYLRAAWAASCPPIVHVYLVKGPPAVRFVAPAAVEYSVG